MIRFENLKIRTSNWKALKFWHSYQDLPVTPRLRLAIVTCMDSRVVGEIFALAPGDALVIRNAGNRITPDVLRSLFIGVFELGVQRILVCGHTNCGTLMSKEKADKIVNRVSEESRIPSEQIIRHLGGKDSFSALGAIHDVFENVRESVEALHRINLFPESIQFSGAVYHVETGETEFLMD